MLGAAGAAGKVRGGHLSLLRSSRSPSSEHVLGRLGTLREAGCRGVIGPVPSTSLDAERDAPALCAVAV
jgi:hypothetical protein